MFDVGANDGQYRDFLREFVGFDGTVVSFEPNPDLVSSLQTRAMQDPSWHVVPSALGAIDGTAPFNMMEDSVFSSFLIPNNAETPNIVTQNRVRETRLVAVMTLDGVFPDLQNRLGFRRPYLKLDTQGYDLEVLKGARATLKCFSAVQTEASVRPIYDGAPDYRKTIDSLERLNFGLSGMFTVTDGQFPWLMEFDCVMVNRDR